MDLWKFFDITHREHVFCNPMSEVKFDTLISLLRVKQGAKVLEIATGKGEFILRLAEKYGIEGIGIDISPFFIQTVKEKQQNRIPNASLTFLQMDGANYTPEENHYFDLVACIGASWIYKGHEGTLKALMKMAAPGGWIVVGEPYWRQEPNAEYLTAIGEERNTFGTHYENVKVGEKLGLSLLYTVVSNQDDWDEYEGLQLYAAMKWAGENPNDPDVDEVMKRVQQSKENYLRWGRDTFGWAIYVFRKER